MKFAIADRYPIETSQQLEKAAEYFTKYLTRLSPSQRVEAASSLEKRAGELSVDLGHGWITNYARLTKTGAMLSPSFDNGIQARIGACQGAPVHIGGKAVSAESVLRKIASDRSAPVQLIAHVLEEFDKTAGLEIGYDVSIPDPVMTVVGCDTNPEYDAVKVAGKMTDYDCRRLASDQDGLSKVASVLGEGFCASFKKDPVAAVSGLKRSDKLAFANIGAR